MSKLTGKFGSMTVLLAILALCLMPCSKVAPSILSQSEPVASQMTNCNESNDVFVGQDISCCVFDEAMACTKLEATIPEVRVRDNTSQQEYAPIHYLSMDLYTNTPRSTDSNSAIHSQNPTVRSAPLFILNNTLVI
ncbi:MAG: hypothetical protein JKX97_02465 [Candidatus Lindowbacteria bacterium]|nr:hypothetical protein [Candidatus Lindowbacteria bacterium]